MFAKSDSTKNEWHSVSQVKAFEHFWQLSFTLKPSQSLHSNCSIYFKLSLIRKPTKPIKVKFSFAQSSMYGLNINPVLHTFEFNQDNLESEDIWTDILNSDADLLLNYLDWVFFEFSILRLLE